jgi:hypothetical protein
MKVQGKVSRTQTIEGSISKAELLALVRETINIPAEAEARFYLPSQQSVMAQQQGVYAQVLSYVYDNEPLQFRITWSLPVGKDEQG